MNTTIELVKQLRSETGAGIMECHKALESSQDYETALTYLREKAEMAAGKKSDREALEGKIELYSHNNGRIGVMVEINSETEFASRSDVFRKFAHEVALQITAAAPVYVRDEEIPPDVLAGLAQETRQKALAAGKPENVIEKIVAGVIEKNKNQQVLLRQLYIRDETRTVAQLLNQAIGQIGENIVIRRFVRWEICPEAES